MTWSDTSGARTLAVAAAFASFSAQIACDGQRDEAPSRQRLEVQVVGCALIDGAGSCTLDSQRTLRLWVPAPWAQTATFHSEAEPVEVREQTVIEGGMRATLTVPRGARSVGVRSEVGGTAFAYRLQLRDAPRSQVLERAIALRRAGNLEEAMRLLDAVVPELSGVERARALGLLARVHLGLGQYEQARLFFERAIEADRMHGAVSLEMEDASALSFLMITRLSMFQEAKVLLDATREVANKTADGRARFPYFEGLLHFETGDLRRALFAFRKSRDAAQRLGLGVHERTARDRVAAVLQALGRTTEAIEELHALRDTKDPAISDCERADVLINLGWYYVEAPQAKEADFERATQLLTDARALFPQKCRDPFREAVTLTNLAYAALRSGAADAARRYLSEARSTAQVEESLQFWWLDLEGRLALFAKSGTAAREAFARAERLADDFLLPDLRFRALTGLGEAFELLRDTKRALDAYAQAEAVLDQHALLVPLGEGRAAFLSTHDVSARALIELQLRRSEAKGAFETARHARTRLLQALEESARLSRLDAPNSGRWLQIVSGYGRARAELLALARTTRDLPVDQLQQAEQSRKARQQALLTQLELELASLTPAEASASEPLSPELTLLYRPLREGWVGFAVRSGTVQAYVFQREPHASETIEGTSAWLAPFTKELAHAEEVRVMPEGKLSELDFHALLFQSRPLVAQAAVTYPLDLPTLPMAKRAEKSALVISDPSGDLPLAREEATMVSAQLRARAVRVQRLEGMQATTRAVASVIPSADHIHFAGHAWFGGEDGFESELRLASGESMSLGDVLASSISARTVILSGCKAAQVRSEKEAGLGMASAFAVAGASTVIAPTRTIDDADTARLMELLYEHAQRFTDTNWVHGLQSAQLALHEERPRADWSAFRVLTR